MTFQSTATAATAAPKHRGEPFACPDRDATPRADRPDKPCSKHVVRAFFGSVAICDKVPGYHPCLDRIPTGGRHRAETR